MTNNTPDYNDNLYFEKLQKSKNVANNVTNENLQDLTEQWEKGKLPEGWYWVDYYSVDGAVMLEYIPQHNGFGYEEKNLVQAVLAEVPDYIEWQNMVNCACEEHKANTELLEKTHNSKDC